MSGPVIRLRGVTAGYSRAHPALRGVDLEVQQGEFLAVIGPNGGGKTTLLKTILGLLEPFEGTVEVLGEPPGRENRSRTGYVPQVIPQREFPATVMDVVLMGRLGRKALFRGFSADDRLLVAENLKKLGIEGLAGERMDRLSGGQKQRVLIARALAGNPDILLLDEPLASVDMQTQQSFYNLLAKLNDRMTIVMVTHDVGAVSSHVKSMACINTTIVSHGETISEDDVSRAYGCPFELVAHGVPHRVLGRPGGRDNA